jgi:hypothetical protein
MLRWAERAGGEEGRSGARGFANRWVRGWVTF